MNQKIVTIGVDEVGRGPLAGPVAVGALVILDENAVKCIFRDVKESKQLSESRREEWFAKIKEAQKEGMVRFCVAFQSQKSIDARGLSYAIKMAVRSAVYRLRIDPTNAQVLLDGGLRAPAAFVHQKTIIKGDEKEMSIALASICAKVLRDRRMNVLAKKYPQYGFEKHKGYGTKAHYSAISEHGLIVEHRRSFLRSFGR